MTLPIALGGKCESAQQLPGPCCHPGSSDDGSVLEPLELYQTLAWGVCPKNEWLVRVTASYYDLIVPDTGHREITMVEVRVQVSFLTRPLSPNYRETSHHLKLFDGAKDEYPQSQPQVVISEDRRNLAVLLFHPHQQSSAVVIFQLRIPRTDLNIESPIPLPSYCASTGNDNNASSVFSREAPMVASHPRFVSVWGISTICSIPNVSPPIILAICHHGGVVWLDVRSSLAVASGMLHVKPEQLPFSSLVAAPTSIMEKGTLLAVSSKTGSTILASWKIEKKTRVEQTFLKRASTGAVVVQAPSSRISNLPSPTRSVRRTPSSGPPVTKHFNRVAPLRTVSAGATPNVQRALKSVFSPERMKSISPMFTQRSPLRRLAKDGTVELPDLTSHLFGKVQNKNNTEADAEKRKEHMDTFVMKELQKKTEPGANLSLGVDSTSAVNMNNNTIQRPRRRVSETAAGGNTKETMMRSMQLEIMSTLEEEVVDAQFGALSTIFCAVYKATSKKPRVAQIFSLCDAGTFQPVISLSLSSEQVENATDVTRKVGSPGEKTMTTSMSSQLGAGHDARSDCFAISTTFGGKWIGFVWNWRSNALGWLVRNSTSIDRMLWTRLYFGRHAQQGSHFVYLESTQTKYLQTRKEVVATGYLSAPDSHTTAIEPCSLLLGSESISFPDATQRETGVSELEWKACKIPFTYLNAYGPPQLAAVGRLHGNTLAVASSCGVCILDSKHRWKQFGSPAEEKTFSIVAMTWWEGTVGKGFSTGPLEEESGDLLVAIIQSNNGRQYLSCWSPHRLDLAHQLLEPRKTRGSEQTNESSDESWGIPLTKSVKATNLSLLAEPGKDESKSRSNDPRRAVVLVSSADMGTCSVDYAFFQLQLRRKDQDNSAPAESYVEQKPYSVMVNPSAEGTIQNGIRSVGPVSSVFLAGASFRFDLAMPGEIEENFVGLVGAVRAPGGIEAIALSSKGKASFSPLIDAHEVSRVSLADIVHTPPNSNSDQGPLSNCFVWLIELLSGEIFTWSAPYLLSNGASEGDFQSSSFLRETKIARPKGLRPPTLVCKKEIPNAFLLGTLCHIGTSSDWMQQTSSGCQTDIGLGNIPRSIFGCVLRAGQTSRNLHRNVDEYFETDLFPADFLEPEVYGPTTFMMTPPIFVSSLYSMFLEAAYLRTEIPVMEESKVSSDSALCAYELCRLKAIERHVEYRLRASPHEDATMMALRLLIIRSVEMVANVNKKHSKERSDVTHSNVLLASALFSEVADAVRRCTTNLQFASLFLEAGRQVEPSCLGHLFPLPNPGKSLTAMDASHRSIVGRLSACSVIELFTLCVEEGSLAASASALPLMGSRIEARNYCDLLLSKSIEAFIANTRSANSKIDVTQEERRVIGDIFRYGMKLEDSGRLEEKMLQDESTKEEESKGMYATLDDPDDVATFGGTLGTGTSDSSVSSTEIPIKKSGHNLICIGGRQSSILNYLVPSIFNDPKEEEEAIRKAASSFIDTQLDSSHLDFLVQPSDLDEEDEDLPTSVGNIDVQSVGGLVSDIIVNMLIAPKTDCHWRAMSSLARLLLQGEVNQVNTFARAGESVQWKELENLVPDGYEGVAMERVVKFVVAEMGRCEFSLNDQQARVIIDLALRLLGRLEEFPLPRANHSFVTSGLLLVGLIAGHVAGRTPMLLADLEDDHTLVTLYERALNGDSVVV